MGKLNGKTITIVQDSGTKLPSTRVVRSAYVSNMREYIVSQNYVGKIQDCVKELRSINDVIKENNSKPFVDADGIVNEDFIDLESTKVRIVALTKAIDTNLKLLNKVLPDARDYPLNEKVKEEKDDTESFSHALREVEKKVVNQRIN